MRSVNWNGTALFLIVIAGVLTTPGCSRSQQQPGHQPAVAEVPEHGEWWCGGHGVPEEECARCDKSLVEKFKANGDWCKEHDRPESQCFLCDPSRFERFAARYEAKYGKRPPIPKD